MTAASGTVIADTLGAHQLAALPMTDRHTSRASLRDLGVGKRSAKVPPPTHLTQPGRGAIAMSGISLSLNIALQPVVPHRTLFA